MSPRITPIYLAVLLLSCMPAYGDKVDCTGEISRDIDADLMIAAACILRDIEVDGDISLYAGGSLVAEGVEIEGDIRGDLADFIELRNTEVDGDIDLKDMVGDRSSISDSTIDGKLSLDDNRSALEVRRNYIDKDLKIVGNSGGVVISDNVIDGNLDCKENTPAPELSNNSVANKEKNQCATPNPPEKSGPSGDDDEDGTAGGGDISVVDNSPPEINIGTGGGGTFDPASSLLFVCYLVLTAARRRSPAFKP